MKFLKIFLVLLGFTVQFGQSQTAPPTQDILHHSLVKNLPFENIGVLSLCVLLGYCLVIISYLTSMTFLELAYII